MKTSTMALMALLVGAAVIGYAAFTRLPAHEAPSTPDRVHSLPPSSIGQRHPQSPPSSERSAVAPPAEAVPYSVSGIVRDCETQSPLTGAKVDVTLAMGDGLKTARSTSDSSGTFQFTVSAASITEMAVLDAAASGYETGHWQVRDGEKGKTFCLRRTQ